MLIKPEPQTHHRSLSLFSQSFVVVVVAWERSSVKRCCKLKLCRSTFRWRRCYKLKLCMKGAREHYCCKGSREHCLRGTLLGGAWRIVAYYCKGVGKHCCVQEWCCEQNEVVWGMTLQEEHSKVVTKVIFRKEHCWCKFVTTCFLFFIFYIATQASFFLTTLQKKMTTSLLIYFSFLIVFVSKEDDNK
jgi:hypothetical protein